MKDPSEWVYNEENNHDSARHEAERVSNGFSTYDWWNFSDYLIWVNIQGLEKFKNGAGYPADLNSMEEWQEELQTMIDGFEAAEKISNDFSNDKSIRESFEKGMALYAKRFLALWD